MKYNAQDARGRTGWIVEETTFDANAQGKCEAIMCIGNGYLGARTATEESYVGQVRNTFVAGTFNRFDASEVTELPNAADVFAVDIRINADRFSLLEGTINRYSRRLNLATGEVTREVDWTSPSGARVQVVFQRFASMHDRHLVCSRTSVKPLQASVDIKLSSGIDGQRTNSGTQHFIEGERRIYDGRILEYVSSTTESGLDFVVHASHRISTGKNSSQLKQTPRLERRQVFVDVAMSLEVGEELVVEKQARFFTSLDADIGGADSLAELRRVAADRSQAGLAERYETLLSRSREVWSKLWRDVDVRIDGDSFDQLAIRFAIYHMTIFTPAHDSRFGIGAKGLSGEGYKGHSFWDSEIFVLPFFVFSRPNLARRLLEYRYLTLPGARTNAAARGFRGAMYAWESATTGEEVTPEWGAVDIHTGEATRIWSGALEQHITADIAFAVWNYFRASNDVEFMDSMGYEMLFETATFWCSRLEWLDDRELWGICNVIGPDEYKEHVDNNAFTNHMAAHNIQLAIEYYEELSAARPQVLQRLQESISLSDDYEIWKDRLGSIYLPKPRKADGLLPQDDSYLQKRDIDLSRYKKQSKVGTLFDDFNLDQVNEIQVSKQADVVALFWLLRHRFSDESLRANWDYYEPRTLHDSSLSLASHVCVAAELGDVALAYEMFTKASRIDLGPAMNTSDHGIHAAAMGGIWQAVVCGFGGLRVRGLTLEIDPVIPASWNSMQFALYWHGQRLRVNITRDSVSIERESGDVDVELLVQGEAVRVPAREVARA